MKGKPKKGAITEAESLAENKRLRARLKEVEQALAALQDGQASGQRAVGVEGGPELTERAQQASARRVLQQQQQALDESQERLSLTAIAGQVGIFDWNVLTDELQWTRQHEVIFGYSPASSLRTIEDWRQRVHPEDLPWVEAQVRREMAGQARFESEYRVVWPDGSVHWVDVTAKFDHDGEGRCLRMLGAVRDITEQKLAERERETTIEFLRMVNESSTLQALLDGAVDFFQHQTGCEAVGIRLQVGEDFPYFLADGFSLEFLRTENTLCARDHAGEILRDDLGRPLLECLCGHVICGEIDPASPFFTANGSFWTNSTAQLLTDKAVADRQTRVRHRCHGEGYESVALIPLHTGTQRLGLIQLNDRRPGMFSVRNIHLWERLFGYLAVAIARFKADEEVRASQRRHEFLASILENSSQPFAVGYPDGSIGLSNKAFQRLTGYSGDELRALDWGTGLTPPAWREIERTKVEELKRSGRPVSYEKEYQRKDGSRVFVELLVHFVADALGHPEYYYAFVTDISERKQAEERLQASLHEKEVLLKEIHHRVKNNLQVISSLVDLQADSIVDPVLSGLFQEVRDRVRSMALVHEKLYSSENLVQVDFAEYAAGLLNYLWRAHGSLEVSVRLTLDLQPISLAVETAVPCGLLLNELAVNALKHAFAGRDTGEVVVSLYAGPDDLVRLSVKDDGVGLPGQGLDWRRNGSLGLSLVQMLTKQLKGALEVASGSGTEFQITFPVGAGGKDGRHGVSA